MNASSLPRPLWLRYAVAVGSVVLGWLAREALTPAVGPTALPFISFFPSVAVAAWYGGFGPALLATALAGLAANYFFLDPVHTLSIHSSYNAAVLLAFVLAALFIVGAIEAMHRARARLVSEIAERERVERELAKSRDLFAITLASIGDGVIATDAEGRITFLNHVAETLTGWSKDDAVGQPLPTVFRIIHEETGEPAEDPVGRALREGAVVGLANHTVLMARDASERPIEDSAAPIRDQGGAIIGVVLVFRDATQRRRLEQLQETYQANLEKQVRERTHQARMSEERFRLLVEGTKEYAIYMLDPEGHVVSWNPGAERIKGYRADEIIGHHFSRFYTQEDAEQGKPRRELERAAALEKYEEEGWRVRKNGARFWASVVVTALHDETGKLRGYSKITRDLTEKKEAEETARRLLLEEARRQAVESEARAVAEQRERLKVTLHSIGDGVITTDAEGRVTMLNPVAESLSGWTLAEAFGQPLESVFQIINEASREPVENPVARVLATGQIAGLANHTVLIAKDGTERPIDDSAAPIRDHQGRVTGVVLVFRDITARRQEDAERRKGVEELAEAEERMRSVVNNVVDGIITIDERGTVQSFNPAAERLFAYRRDEVVGRNVKMLMPEPYHGEHDGYVSNYLVTGIAKIIGIGREVVGRRKDGSTFPMELAVSEFYIGGRRYFTGIARDITERKRAEAALIDADRRKDEFLAILAHELRNPLAPIRNAVELLRRAGSDTGVIEQARGTMERQVGHMVRLVDDLLDVSRITRGSLRLRKERVDLASVVQSAIEANRRFIESSGHKLTVTLPPDSIYLEADPTRIAQVLSNLLNNAAKYTEKQGHIQLIAEQCDGEVAVSVRDTGIGIVPEHLPNIFEMFSQIEPALERSQSGLGIGLSLVRGLVELHGGAVEAKSAGAGKGCEFTVRLPVVEATQQAPAEPQEKQEDRPSVMKCRILLVDDYRDSTDSLQRLLRLEGHEVHTAYDGVEAVQRAEMVRPDMVLLDIGLPKMNGYEAARHIREQPWGKNMALVALTGWGQQEDKRRALEAGFNHHLTKPVDPAALDRLLSSIAPRHPQDQPPKSEVETSSGYSVR